MTEIDYKKQKKMLDDKLIQEALKKSQEKFLENKKLLRENYTEL